MPDNGATGAGTYCTQLFGGNQPNLPARGL
jgi:hypothetical protein